MNPKLLNCKKCGHLVARVAPKCTGCGTSPRTFGYKRWTSSIAGGIVTVVVLVALGEFLHNKELNVEQADTAVSEVNSADPTYGTVAGQSASSTIGVTDRTTPQEMAYAGVLSHQVSVIADSMSRFGVLSGSPRLDDDAWRQKVSTELAIWKGTYREASDADPPPRLALLNADYVKALAEYNAAADDCADALNQEDVGLMKRANDELMAGNQELQQVYADFSQLNRGEIPSS